MYHLKVDIWILVQYSTPLNMLQYSRFPPQKTNSQIFRIDIKIAYSISALPFTQPSMLFLFWIPFGGYKKFTCLYESAPRPLNKLIFFLEGGEAYWNFFSLVSMIPSPLVERFGVSRIRDFCCVLARYYLILKKRKKSGSFKKCISFSKNIHLTQIMISSPKCSHFEITN